MILINAQASMKDEIAPCTYPSPFPYHPLPPTIMSTRKDWNRDRDRGWIGREGTRDSMEGRDGVVAGGSGGREVGRSVRDDRIPPHPSSSYLPFPTV